jgi:hypothetical protein
MNIGDKDVSSISERVQECSIKLIDIKKDVLETVKETNRSNLKDFQALKDDVAVVRDSANGSYKTCELVDIKVNQVKLDIEKIDRQTKLNYSEIRSLQNNKAGLYELEEIKNEFDKNLLTVKAMIKSLNESLESEKF